MTEKDGDVALSHSSQFFTVLSKFERTICALLRLI